MDKQWRPVFLLVGAIVVFDAVFLLFDHFSTPEKAKLAPPVNTESLPVFAAKQTPPVQATIPTNKPVVPPKPITPPVPVVLAPPKEVQTRETVPALQTETVDAQVQIGKMLDLVKDEMRDAGLTETGISEGGADGP